MRHRTVTIEVPERGTERSTSTDNWLEVAAHVCRIADEYPGQDISMTVRTDYENETPPVALGARSS